MLRALLFGVALLFAPSIAGAQPSPDPSGHWVGTVDLPTMQMGIEVDLARSPSGQFFGTLSTPAQKLVGLPLSKVDVKGTSIAFEARNDQGFAGILSADGNDISGDFAFQVYNFPFTLARAGIAKIDSPPTSAPITKDLEGAWDSTLAADGTRMRLVLTLANHADGTSTGTLTNLDEGSLEIPVATITQRGSDLALTFTVVEGSYAATVNADNTELTGTWRQGASSAPITFKREASDR